VSDWTSLRRLEGMPNSGQWTYPIRSLAARPERALSKSKLHRNWVCSNVYETTSSPTSTFSTGTSPWSVCTGVPAAKQHPFFPVASPAQLSKSAARLVAPKPAPTTSPDSIAPHALKASPAASRMQLILLAAACSPCSSAVASSPSSKSSSTRSALPRGSMRLTPSALA